MKLELIDLLPLLLAASATIIGIFLLNRKR